MWNISRKYLNNNSRKSGKSDCALLIDYMDIRKKNHNTCQEKHVKFVDYGNITPENSEKIASEASVFMLVGLNYSWKGVVSFSVTDKRDADIQISLVKSCFP